MLLKRSSAARQKSRTQYKPDFREETHPRTSDRMLALSDLPYPNGV